MRESSTRSRWSRSIGALSHNSARPSRCCSSSFGFFCLSSLMNLVMSDSYRSYCLLNFMALLAIKWNQPLFYLVSPLIHVKRGDMKTRVYALLLAGALGLTACDRQGNPVQE